MKIELKNLGPVKSANIDLSKELTIFCGPNNSGKTYVAFVIYALTKSGNKYFRDNEGVKLVSDLFKKGEVNFSINTEKIWIYRDSELSDIASTMDSIFGVSEDVMNHLFKSFNIKILETKESFSKRITDISFSHIIELKETSILIEKEQNTKTVYLKLQSKVSSKNEIHVLSLFLISKIYSLIAFYPFTSSIILPVERNSIYTFSKELSIQKQEFLEQAQELGSKKSKDPFHWFFKRSTRYPMPIRDGLEIAEDLSNLSKTKSSYYDFAIEIETELLNGSIVVNKDGDVQFCTNKAKSKKIPIHLTASIVKTLSSLVFYLKHIAMKGDLIIIDEPELNLHPNNQIVLTRIFAKLVNNGFRLLISTHSDYIIREINNLIMSSSTKNNVAELASKIGYNEDLRLLPENVNAYLFNYKNKNSRNVTISPINVSETGFDVITIDETVDVLNDNSEKLFYTLKYGMEEEEEVEKDNDNEQTN